MWISHDWLNPTQNSLTCMFSLTAVAHRTWILASSRGRVEPCWRVWTPRRSCGFTSESGSASASGCSVSGPPSSGEHGGWEPCLGDGSTSGSKLVLGHVNLACEGVLNKHQWFLRTRTKHARQLKQYFIFQWEFFFIKRKYFLYYS